MPTLGVATDAQAGRSCPYCRFALKAGVDIVQCGACGSVHHSECWTDNSGCSIVACASGPGSSTPTLSQPAAAVAMAAPPPRLPPPPPLLGGLRPPQPPAGRRRSAPVLIVAILVLALAITGAAVALVMTRQNSSANASHAGTTTQGTGDEGSGSLPPVPTETATPEPEPTETATAEPVATPSSGVLPDESRSQMRRDIQDMLRTWHQDIVDGDSQSAWDMLTERKQRQNTIKYGYDGWVHGQASLAPYLDPSGLHVTIQDVDSRTGVARVLVTGMRWNKAGANCSEWSGVTWVRYESGSWRYDPGYSTTPQREREWKSRYSELLGGTC
jgi:hypothetical protein